MDQVEHGVEFVDSFCCFLADVFRVAGDAGDAAVHGSFGDGGGDGAAILLVGGAAVAGLVGYGVYSYVSEQQLKALLPEGVAMPENRAQTALLLWNTAGRPEPAAHDGSSPTYKTLNAYRQLAG
mgnify:CR=1 FL=1